MYVYSIIIHSKEPVILPDLDEVQREILTVEIVNSFVWMCRNCITFRVMNCMKISSETIVVAGFGPAGSFFESPNFGRDFRCATVLLTCFFSILYVRTILYFLPSCKVTGYLEGVHFVNACSYDLREAKSNLHSLHATIEQCLYVAKII